MLGNSFTGGSVYRVDTATLSYLSTFNELSISKFWTIINPKSLENNWEFWVRLEKFEVLSVMASLGFVNLSNQHFRLPASSSSCNHPLYHTFLDKSYPSLIPF